MNFFGIFVNLIKMLYQIILVAINCLSVCLNILWLCCTIASAGIPWITLLFICVCVASKFVKLKSPNKKRILHVLGQDLSFIVENDLKFGYLIWTVANRAGGFDAPENSVEAIKQCTAKKCRNILLDLAMTECGELVVLHKLTLRKANLSVPIEKVKYESLQNFNISEHHPLGHQYPPEKIMNLANLLTILENDSDNNKTIYLLLSNSNTKVVNLLKDFISKNDSFAKRIVICSRSPLAIYQLRKFDPDLICGLWMDKFSIKNKYNIIKSSALLRSVYGAIFRNIIAPVIGISIVFVHKEEFNLNISNLWRHVGIRPVVYPVNLPNEKRYYQQVTQTQYLTDSLRTEPQILLKKVNSLDSV